MKDFLDHKSDWVEPVKTNYRGYDVWELPPNGQGIAALEMLNILEQHDVKGELAFGSTESGLHLLVEAKKLAFADRAKFYSDPDFNDLPVAELISKAYGQRQAQANRSESCRDRCTRRRPATQPWRYDLPHGCRQGSQLLLVHPKQLLRIRFANRSG